MVGIEGYLRPGHGVENGEQLAHAGDDGDLLGFTAVHQALVVSADHGVVARGDDGCHIQGMAHLGAATLDTPTPAQPAGITGHRGDAHEGGDLAAVQATELR